MEKKAVIVYGAGISGRGAAEVLAKRGEQVFLYNDNECTISEELQEVLKANGGDLAIGSEVYQKLLGQAGLLVLSPGVSPTDTENVVAAVKAGIEVIGEVELAYRLYGGHIAAITGTNGKTTTTTIVGEMLKHLPVPSAIGGNVGRSMTKEVVNLPADAWLSAELSSFQLETVKTFAPDVAVILNLTPDHIERHHTMEAYGEAKQNIFAFQTPEQVTVLNYDDPELRTWDVKTKAQVCFFSRVTELEQGAFMRNGDFIIRWQGVEHNICNTKDLLLFGAHNEENVLAAISAGFFAGVSDEDMAEVLRNFRSIEHRIEYVRELDGVKYYNDSKGTNTVSTIKAIEAFPEGHIILLAGGHDKQTPLEDMMNLVKAKVDVLILLGEAKDRFYEAAVKAGVEHIEVVENYDDAVAKAHELAQAPQVVLLAPACSSYDMFNDYLERGRYFKKLVNAL